MNIAFREMGADVLHRPLGRGQPIAYWQIGELVAERYDVPDAPMQGEMDPFFFLTKDKNFIPHEYPCRTQFAAERRGKRPLISGVSSPSRWWLPFGSPRVDFSGFWFRPTAIAAWAQTAIVAADAGTARVRLSTCGGAVLFVNGREAGWLAPYTRNLEQLAEFEITVEAGENRLEVYFDDLAERDARFVFELDYLDGPEAAVIVQSGIGTEAVAAIETILEGLRFDQPTYTGGPVTLRFPRALPIAARANVLVEGDMISHDRTGRQFVLAAGATSLELGPSEELPADFRHFTVTLEAGGFAVRRTLGVEIVHAGRWGEAPATLTARAVEALDIVAEHAEPDALSAIARLATGRAGEATDAMIEGVLPTIEDCHDCADFALVPLLWARLAYGDAIGAATRARLDAAILNYRYWMDEPGNDVQWYFSENHALLFHTAAYLAGGMFPDAIFVRSKRTGAEQSVVGAQRVRAWLDHFERWEMAEFNSAPYFPIDLKGLSALAALARDADIRERAGKGIVRLLEIVARSAHQGVLTAAQGRSYEHSLRPARTLELSAIARLFWRKGWFGRHVHALPMLALLVRDHGFAPPAGLTDVAVHDGAPVEWRFAQGRDRIAGLYHYKSRAFAMGSVASYRWGEWGYQETPLHLRIGSNPDAQIWINHPGEVIQFGSGRPSFWGGNGTLPRVHQYRGLAVLDFAIHEGQPDFTHAWFPIGAFDEHLVDGDRAYARSGEAMVLLKGSGPLELTSAGPCAGVELRLEGRRARWIIRVADTYEAADLGAMRQRLAGLSADDDNGAIVIEDPTYGRVSFGADGVVEAEGRRLDPRGWTIQGEATTLA
jgi:hypothetical protein